MPHIVIKMFPGRSDEQKAELAREIARNVSSIAGCRERSVSVALEEVPQGDWMEKVYEKEIVPNRGKLLIEPGYGSLAED